MLSAVPPALSSPLNLSLARNVCLTYLPNNLHPVISCRRSTDLLRSVPYCSASFRCTLSRRCFLPVNSTRTESPSSLCCLKTMSMVAQDFLNCKYQINKFQNHKSINFKIVPDKAPPSSHVCLPYHVRLSSLQSNLLPEVLSFLSE